MDKNELTQFYDNLKSNLASSTVPATPSMIKVGRPNDYDHPGAELYKRKAMCCRNELEDKCAKHIIVDIYCKILPLDQSYIHGNHGRMCQDVTSMLDNKGMTASQYLTSCSEKTKAPLLEFVQRSIKNIGKAYMEEAKEELKDAQENGEDVVAPTTPDPETDDEIQNQLVDIKDDTEYDSFVDTLKKKTIDKIVSDVTKIINDKKEEKDMTFDPNPEATISDIEAATESTLSVGLNYLQKGLLKESVEVTDDIQDQMMALAIREATLNQLDLVFNQPRSDFKSFASNIRFNKGILINESAVSYFAESSTKDNNNKKTNEFKLYGITFTLPNLDEFIHNEKSKIDDHTKSKAYKNLITTLTSDKKIKNIEDMIIDKERQIGQKTDTDKDRVKRIKSYLSKSNTTRLLFSSDGEAAVQIDIPYTKDICAWLEHELWLTSKGEALSYDEIEFKYEK